jgi:hypothetical protein
MLRGKTCKSSRFQLQVTFSREATQFQPLALLGTGGFPACLIWASVSPCWGKVRALVIWSLTSCLALAMYLGKWPFGGTDLRIGSKLWFHLGVEVHTCNSSTWKAETGELKVGVHPGLHSKTLPSIKKTKQTMVSFPSRWKQKCMTSAGFIGVSTRGSPVTHIHSFTLDFVR